MKIAAAVLQTALVVIGLVHTARAFQFSPVTRLLPAAARASAHLSESPDSEVHQATSLTMNQTGISDNVILFDGVCNFCNMWVDMMLRLDRKQKFKFAPLQSEVGQRLLTLIGKKSNDISSVVLIQPDLQSFAKSSCVLKVVQELGPVARITAGAAERILPLGFRDSIYDVVAERRYRIMGKRDECRCNDPNYADRFI